MKKILAGIIASAAAFLTPATPAKADSDPYLGDIMMVGFNFCPRGWAATEGQLLAINSHQSLYSLLGTQFGGDGVNSFALPDLRGRAIVHEGTGPGLSPYTIGQRAGVETVTANLTELASHSHNFVGDLQGEMMASTNPPTSDDPEGNYFSTFPDGVTANAYAITQTTPLPMASDSVHVDAPTSIGSTGNQLSVNNMQPFQVIKFCIAIQGVFPPRN